ncbi:MAG: hypothetical protein RJA61_104 [Candidatus Parcubacteria bacterium]|jgi:histidyl-tRNA synthetase
MKKTVHEWDHVAQIASYYGFKFVDIPPLSKDDALHVKNVLKQNPFERKSHTTSHAPLFKVDEKIALLRAFGKESVIMSQPTMVLSRIAQKKETIEFSLDIIGTTRSIAEALLIKTSRAILEEEGYLDFSVTLNSIGDRDSAQRFERDIWNYYKKKIAELPHACKDHIRKNPITHTCNDEVCQAIQHDAPRSLGFLSEHARNHFKEVLEFIETINIPYTIDQTLFGHKECFAQTLFELKTKEPGDEKDFVCGFGFRYNPLSRRLGYKKDVPAVGLSCAYKRLKSKIKLKKPKPAQFYFIQLGFEAKLKSLTVIENLRKWGIPILHALARDKITGQISSAEHMNLPFVIIMGQKEAMENSVVVRDAETRAQETVTLEDLPHYLIRIHEKSSM